MVGSLERLQRELTSAQPAGHHVFDSFASRALRDVNLSTSPSSWLLASVYGHPLSDGRVEGRWNVWKVQAAVEIFRRPMTTLELERCQNIFSFFLGRECVCFVLIVISYPQQLHGSITETTKHGTSTIRSDSSCAKRKTEVKDYKVYIK